ncbi:MAG: SDR family oxidoreductase [Acidimicrobiales bacterium]|nr:SDR family oxidoreductase [Acidimicrobiales bacterium]
MTFRGRVAVITGAASGMGQLLAWRLAAQGASVAALDVDEEGLARTTRRAPNIVAWGCDVSDRGAVTESIKDIERNLGPIDRLVNAAAIAPTDRLVDQPADLITRVMETNYNGLVYATKAVLPGLIERNRGDIVQFASMAGWLPYPTFGAYAASKHAVVAFTEVLARELRDTPIRVLCVCPPFVDTPLLRQVEPKGPKVMSWMPKMAPELVLDAMERALDRGQTFVFPGRGTTWLWRFRRFAPKLLDRIIDRLEER